MHKLVAIVRANRGFLAFLLGFALVRTAIADYNPIPSGSMTRRAVSFELPLYVRPGGSVVQELPAKRAIPGQQFLEGGDSQSGWLCKGLLGEEGNLLEPSWATAPCARGYDLPPLRGSIGTRLSPRRSFQRSSSTAT